MNQKKKPDTVNWEMEKVWVVSTGHITNNDDIILSRAAPHGWDKYPYGYMIPLCTEHGEVMEQDLDFVKLGFSAAFLYLLKHARKLKADMIKLDSDGPTYKTLIQFNW